ncbi:Uncharacterised protein [Bordetella ansorpii]|uniref:Uncharacterized protein n=1 Tax=Bordetella ansorpii TaxID=288768 RepID=A0A157MD76_9BORD|nr:hypothetical protein [Bordetella ansorpii]SAI06746.1 Uncharacterised protein [Bordetella ansorpii]
MYKQMRSHVPPPHDPEMPDPPPGDLPVEPDTDNPDIDLPPPDDVPGAPKRGHGRAGGNHHQGRRGSGLYRMRLVRGRAHSM